MSIHIFRPAEAKSDPSPPVGRTGGVVWAVVVRWVLTLLYRIRQSPRTAAVVHTALLLVGLVAQLVLLLTVAYLCDLAISLMELWALLARKHLEITM